MSWAALPWGSGPHCLFLRYPIAEVPLRERPPTGGQENSLESTHTHPHTPSSFPLCAGGATSLRSQSQTQRHWSTVSPGSTRCSVLWPSCQNGGGGPRTDPLLETCTSCQAGLLKEIPWWSLPGSEITGALISDEWSKYFSLALGPLDLISYYPISRSPGDFFGHMLHIPCNSHDWLPLQSPLLSSPHLQRLPDPLKNPLEVSALSSGSSSHSALLCSY